MEKQIYFLRKILSLTCDKLCSRNFNGITIYFDNSRISVFKLYYNNFKPTVI